MNTTITESESQYVILLIDDNEANIGVLVDYLKELGFKTITARNGQMGLKRAQFSRPDLILLDVMMPGIDGFEVCQSLKANPETRDIPVIFMTALHEVEDKVKGFAAGGVDYITKPIQQEEVLARVRTHLRLQAQQRQLQQQAAALTQAKELADSARVTAERANTAKSEFLANMSHELRTPLNAILGFSHLVIRDPTLAPQHREHLKIVHHSGEHLLTLINDVLDMSKIEAGHTTLNKKDFDLDQVLNDLEDMLQLRTRKKGIVLKFERSPEVPRYIRTDETKLRQVLINLIGNGIKFTAEGKVVVRVRSESQSLRSDVVAEQVEPSAHSMSDYTRLHFEVEDTGYGIVQEEMQHLFQPFVQTQIGRAASEGTGLGLAISLKFVQLMGGELSVRSEVGCGSVFSFDIMVQIGEESRFQRKALDERRVLALKAGQPRYRILIVDDKWDNRQLLLTLLNPLGFDLREAANGQEAVEIWEVWEPHVIWLDLRMPVMDGYEAVRKIRKAEKQKLRRADRMIIIAITASSLERDITVALDTGCNDFLRKPFREAEIFEMLHKHLDIQFVHEEDERPFDFAQDRLQGKGERRKGEEELMANVLDGLPDELVSRLKEAVTNTSMGMVENIIAEIRELDATVAGGLAALADEFEYGKMLEMLQKVEERRS